MKTTYILAAAITLSTTTLGQAAVPFCPDGRLEAFTSEGSFAAGTQFGAIGIKSGGAIYELPLNNVGANSTRLTLLEEKNHTSEPVHLIINNTCTADKDGNTCSDLSDDSSIFEGWVHRSFLGFQVAKLSEFEFGHTLSLSRSTGFERKIVRDLKFNINDQTRFRTRRGDEFTPEKLGPFLDFQSSATVAQEEAEMERLDDLLERAYFWHGRVQSANWTTTLQDASWWSDGLQHDLGSVDGWPEFPNASIHLSNRFYAFSTGTNTRTASTLPYQFQTHGGLLAVLLRVFHPTSSGFNHTLLFTIDTDRTSCAEGSDG